jgi:hypothetical protein
MSLNKFTPIAMKCNKEQWEDIKPLLVKDNILTRHIISFDYDTYLTNNYMDIKLNISNVPIWSASFFKRNIYSEWDKNIFLNACGIEEEFVLPEKWCVKVTNENKDVVYRWKLENTRCTTYISAGYYASYNGLWGIKISNDITEITFEQFKKYVLKENNMNTTNTDKRFPFYLQPVNAQKIIDIACSTWKPKLASMWAHNMVLGNSIEISEEFYKEMRNACSVEQHRLFDSIFGKDVEDFPYKVGNWIAIDGVVAKITEINTDSSHIYWIKHTPNANTGGGFSFKCYKNRIRFATSEEIAKASCPYKDGELIWVKTNGVWLLRYSNGKITSSGDAEVYYNQLKDGSVTRWPIHRKAEGITLPE